MRCGVSNYGIHFLKRLALCPPNDELSKSRGNHSIISVVWFNPNRGAEQPYTCPIDIETYNNISHQIASQSTRSTVAPRNKTTKFASCTEKLSYMPRDMMFAQLVR